MASLLPKEFRAFCLALNSVKQWVAAEQAATDRYLFGGAARRVCREAVETCLITGKVLGTDAELHHPVRDGRPPIPLSKDGHQLIEGQSAPAIESDPIEQALRTLRAERNQSWAQLRRGCIELLGVSNARERKGSKGSASNARSLAKKAATVTNLKYEAILAWLDAKGL